MATQSIDCAGCRQFEWVGSSFWFLLRNRLHWLQISMWGPFRGEGHALKLNCHGRIVYKFIKNHRLVHLKYISTQEAETGWSLWVPDLPGLCRNFQASQGYTVSIPSQCLILVGWGETQWVKYKLHRMRALVWGHVKSWAWRIFWCFAILVLGVCFWIPVCFLKKNLKLVE